MENVEIWSEVEKIFEAPKTGVMSTAYGNVPHSRYMMFYNDGKNLYTKTELESVDVADLEKNNLAYIMLGHEEETESSYLEILAETEVVTEQETIDWLREREDYGRFDVEEEEVFIVLKFKPKQIKLMNANDEVDQPEVIELNEQKKNG